MKDINKIRGALYGVAVGDALGAPLEFMNAAEIQTKYATVRDMLPGGWLNVEPGEVTDDTQMTLAVGSGILVCADDPVPYIGKHFILWTMRGPKDIGGTCAGSIAIARAKADQHTMLLSRAGWVQAARRARPNNKNADGNGALMRTVYPGLFYGYIDDAQMHAGDIAEMTHAGVISKETCILYTSMIYYIINNDFCVSARDMITALVKRYDNTEQEIYRRFLEKDACYFPPDGYVAHSMQVALEAICSTNNFEDAIVAAVNRGGDADTNGAITGGLAGAWYGYDNIPNRWVECLDPSIRRQLDAFAEAAANNRD